MEQSFAERLADMAAKIDDDTVAAARKKEQERQEQVRRAHREAWQWLERCADEVRPAADPYRAEHRNRTREKGWLLLLDAVPMLEYHEETTIEECERIHADGQWRESKMLCVSVPGQRLMDPLWVIEAKSKSTGELDLWMWPSRRGADFNTKPRGRARPDEVLRAWLAQGGAM